MLLQPRSWAAHLLMVLAVAAASVLGVWQLHVWQAGRAAAAVDPTTGTPKPLAQLMGGDDPFPAGGLGQPVRFSGSWLPQSTTYVSDRELRGRTGYWVVTPVVAPGGSAMPVVRGWSAHRDAPPVSGTTEITGWLQPSEDSSSTDTNQADDVIPDMSTASLVERVHDDLYSAFVVQKGAGPGLAQVHPVSSHEVSSTDHLRNLLYAFQWWIFAAFAIYIWWRWCRDQVEEEAEEAVRERQPAAG